MRIHFPKRLVYSLLIVLLWLGFVVEGAHALFRDSATLTGTTITTGTAGLLISNSQNASSTIYDHTRPGFTLSLNPGESAERFLLLKNASQADVSLDIDAMAIVQLGDASITPATRVSVVAVDENGLETGDISGLPLAQNANGPHSTVLATIPKGQTQRFKVITRLNESFEGQNQSLAYDLIFTGTQHLVP